MDFSEVFFVSLNLSTFGASFWRIFSKSNPTFKQKTFVFLLYFLFYLFIVLVLSIQTDLKIYMSLRNFFFSEKVLILFGLFFLLTFLLDFNRKNLALLNTPLLAWFLFFLIFGREFFYFGNWKLESLNLFQAQNPILFCLFFPLIFLPNRIFAIVLFTGILISSGIYYYYDKEKLAKKQSKPYIYSKYSSSEFFLSGSFILLEEERGVYEFIRKENVSESIYKFTMKPLRYLNIYERQLAQSLIEEFFFPIILRENDKIVIYEMFRIYKGNLLRIEIDRFSLDGEIKGPKF